MAVAFRAGYYNIGAEGQFLAGAMGATVPGLYLADLPRGVALPLALVGRRARPACCGRCCRRGSSAVAGIDEVVTTLLLNPVALLLLQGLLNGPWRHPRAASPTPRRSGPATSCRRSSAATGCTPGC